MIKARVEAPVYGSILLTAILLKLGGLRFNSFKNDICEGMFKL